jgi:hypothetical protein
MHVYLGIYGHMRAEYVLVGVCVDVCMHNVCMHALAHIHTRHAVCIRKYHRSLCTHAHKNIQVYALKHHGRVCTQHHMA